MGFGTTIEVILKRLKLAAFAEGSRQNDIYEQMRETAKQLTRNARRLRLHAITGASDH